MAVYISEYRFEGNSDFIEVVATDGEDLSGYTIALYDQFGNFQYSNTLAGQYNYSFAGNDGYLLDSSDELINAQDAWAVALIDDQGNVVQFIGSDGGVITANDGPVAGETSTPGPATNGSQSAQSNDDGATYSASSSPSPGTIPCYAPGTMIATPDGTRAVETLRPGDLVLTVDHGAQPIRWVRSGDHPLEQAADDAKPVLIKAGALGAGCPAQDLIVSPQHRMLVGGGQLDGWFTFECFAPAKSLTSLPGIRHMRGKTSITWVHFACDRHEVVFANGCKSESLLLGPMVVKGLTRSERRALMAIYGVDGRSDAALNGPAARPCRTVGDIRQQLAACKPARPKRTVKTMSKWDIDLALEQSGICPSRLPPARHSKPVLRSVQ